MSWLEWGAEGALSYNRASFKPVFARNSGFTKLEKGYLRCKISDNQEKLVALFPHDLTYN